MHPTYLAWAWRHFHISSINLSSICDDLLLFVRGVKSSVNIIIKSLEWFDDMISMHVKWLKSKIYLVEMDEQIRDAPVQL